MKHKIEFLRVEATRHDGEWTWNDSFWVSSKMASDKEVEKLLTPRAILRGLRERGHFTEKSKGRLRVERFEGDPTTIEIQDKNTNEPLFAYRVHWAFEEKVRSGTGLANHRSPFGPFG